MYVPAHPDALPRLQPAKVSRPTLAPVKEAPSAAAADDPPAIVEPKPPTFLRLSAGFVYFYFGFLKFFPDLSPAEILAGETLTRMSGHMISASTAIWLLAWMEVVIGLCFLFDFQLRRVFWLFLFHQACTFLPLFLVPEFCFKFAPFAPSMEGQYILKNLISLSAGLTVLLPAMKAARAAKRARRTAAVTADGYAL